MTRVILIRRYSSNVNSGKIHELNYNQNWWNTLYKVLEFFLEYNLFPMIIYQWLFLTVKSYVCFSRKHIYMYNSCYIKFIFYACATSTMTQIQFLNILFVGNCILGDH